MAGQTNFPTALDDDVSLYDVSDGVSSLMAAHHNNMKEAIKAIETKLGINITSSVTTIDYRLGHPTGSHDHDGASGMGVQINPSTMMVPTGGVPSGLTLFDHMMASAYHSPDHYIQLFVPGSIASGTNRSGFPVGLVRPFQLISYSVMARVAPSGATTSFYIMMGATSTMAASIGLRPVLRPGATSHFQASPNLVSVPSGAIIRLDVDKVGSNDPGRDISVLFRFRE